MELLYRVIYEFYNMVTHHEFHDVFIHSLSACTHGLFRGGGGKKGEQNADSGPVTYKRYRRWCAQWDKSKSAPTILVQNCVIQALVHQIFFII